MIIFTLDVLALPGDGIGQRQPSPEGRRLWHLFVSKGHTLVLLVPLQEPKPHVNRWLGAENYRPDLVYEYLDSGPTATYEAAAALRAIHKRADFFIDTSPASIAAAIGAGIPSLLAAFPTAKPDWRVRERVAWGDLVQRMEYEQEQRREAARAHEDD